MSIHLHYIVGHFGRIRLTVPTAVDVPFSEMLLVIRRRKGTRFPFTWLSAVSAITFRNQKADI